MALTHVVDDAVGLQPATRLAHLGRFQGVLGDRGELLDPLPVGQGGVGDARADEVLQGGGLHGGTVGRGRRAGCGPWSRALTRSGRLPLTWADGRGCPGSNGRYCRVVGGI